MSRLPLLPSFMAWIPFRTPCCDSRSTGAACQAPLLRYSCPLSAPTHLSPICSPSSSHIFSQHLPLSFHAQTALRPDPQHRNARHVVLLISWQEKLAKCRQLWEQSNRRDHNEARQQSRDMPASVLTFRVKGSKPRCLPFMPSPGTPPGSRPCAAAAWAAGARRLVAPSPCPAWQRRCRPCWRRAVPRAPGCACQPGRPPAGAGQPGWWRTRL